MRRKTISALAFSLVAFAIAAPLDGQGRRMGGMGPNLDQQMADLTEVLSLTDEQVPQVREILEMQGEKRREMMQGMRGSGDRQAMMSAMQTHQEETTTMLGEVLTDEQMEKYEAHVAEMRQRRRPPL